MPELQLLHRWLDTWTGVGLVAVGMHRYAEVLSERLRNRVLRGIAGLCALQRQPQLAGDPLRHYDYHRAK